MLTFPLPTSIMGTFIRMCYILFYLLPSITGHSYDPDGFKTAADYLLEAIDTNANPCKDFYQFACGNWKRKYTGQYTAEMVKVTKTHEDNLVNLIKNIKEDVPDTPEYQKRLKVFFDQCIQTPADTTEILKNIYMKTVKHIGPMPLLDPDGVQYQDPYYLLGFIERQFGAKVLIHVEVTLIEEECGPKPVIELKPFRGYIWLSDIFNQTFPDKLIKLALDIGANVDESLSPTFQMQRQAGMYQLYQCYQKLILIINFEK